MPSTFDAISREAYTRLSGRPQKYGPGFRFGHLMLLQRNGNRAVLECSCGNIVEVSLTALTQGGKTDCGHIAAELDLEQQEARSGGMLYWTWRNMLNRCEDPHNPSYPNYGGRGIKVCERWHDFEEFAKDIGPKVDGTTLDRRDNDGNYEPSNVWWATPQEQVRNRRVRKTTNNETKE